MASDVPRFRKITPVLLSGPKRLWRAPTVIVSTADATEKVASTREFTDGNAYGPS